MTWSEASCFLQGPSFSPRTVEDSTELFFLEKNEPGEIGQIGRFRNKPIPYGSSTLSPPFQATTENPYYGVEWLIDIILAKRQFLVIAGAIDIILRLNVYHDGQCNLEFDQGILKKIGDGNIVLTISCYEDANYV